MTIKDLTPIVSDYDKIHLTVGLAPVDVVLPNGHRVQYDKRFSYYRDTIPDWEVVRIYPKLGDFDGYLGFEVVPPKQ